MQKANLSQNPPGPARRSQMGHQWWTHLTIQAVSACVCTPLCMCAGMHRCACAWVCVCYMSKCVDVIEYVYVYVSMCVPLQEKKSLRKTA